MTYTGNNLYRVHCLWVKQFYTFTYTKCISGCCALVFEDGEGLNVGTKLRRDILYIVMSVVFKLYDLNPHKCDVLIMKYIHKH